MGLLSNSIRTRKLKPGDHIYSWRTAYIYAHHGIYVGDNKVIHFTRQGQEVGTGTILDDLLVSSGSSVKARKPCPTCNPNSNPNCHGVLASCLKCFLSGGVLYRFKYSVSTVLFLANARGGTCTLAVSDPADVVTHRAEYLLENGFGCYSLFKHNCEDFAVYCKTGLLVLDKKSKMGQSRQADSIIGGPLAAVMSTSLMLFTTNVYGIVAMAVGVYCAGRYAAEVGRRSSSEKVEVEELTRRLEMGTLSVDDRVMQPMKLPHEAGKS